jgi:hypothetical protein
MPKLCPKGPNRGRSKNVPPSLGCVKAHTMSRVGHGMLVSLQREGSWSSRRMGRVFERSGHRDKLIMQAPPHPRKKYTNKTHRHNTSKKQSPHPPTTVSDRSSGCAPPQSGSTEGKWTKEGAVTDGKTLKAHLDLDITHTQNRKQQPVSKSNVLGKGAHVQTTQMRPAMRRSNRSNCFFPPSFFFSVVRFSLAAAVDPRPIHPHRDPLSPSLPVNSVQRSPTRPESVPPRQRGSALFSAVRSWGWYTVKVSSTGKQPGLST